MPAHNRSLKSGIKTMRLRIVVDNDDGTAFNVEVPNDATVDDLIEKIKKEAPQALQEKVHNSLLWFEHEQPKSRTRALKDYKIGDNDVVDVVAHFKIFLEVPGDLFADGKSRTCTLEVNRLLRVSEVLWLLEHVYSVNTADLQMQWPRADFYFDRRSTLESIRVRPGARVELVRVKKAI
ncbi:hypothetical protein Tsubulata_021331 [Turnera subulata]|uniref:Crinkler effector protein N-terminal domain-containing protein n=1 Tax=Turnera subulata TaxID=218843 RepID=A0A9Q0JGZ8_9ROSI|nr:hypothetical protein Tsubulata_021331 [Turnera subulata]